MRESSIVRKIVKAVKGKYPRSYLRKISDRYQRGMPDLLILFWYRASWADGLVSQVLFVEAKTDKGRQSKIQKQEERQIVRSGGCYFVATDEESVLAKLAEMGAVD